MPAMNAESDPTATNPERGMGVIMNPFSGPKGSPLDARKIVGWIDGTPQYEHDPENLSTGGLNTGIGHGPTHNANSNPDDAAELAESGFTPGVLGLTRADGTTVNDSTMVAIGGGRSDAQGNTIPYPASAAAIMGFGNRRPRDAGPGPAHTGFNVKLCQALQDTPELAELEPGYVNNSGAFVKAGEYAYGVSETAATPARKRT